MLMASNYYNFLDRILDYKSKIKYFDIDFNKPWLTETILKKPFFVAISIVSEMIQAVFLTVSPISIGYIFQTRKYEYLWLFCSIYIFFELVNRVVWSMQNYLIEVNGGSLLISANKFLLTTDPINHTFRSSGQIISKIEKSIASLKDFFFIIIDDFVPVITSLVTLIITFLSVDLYLGLICLFSLTLIGGFNIFMAFYNGKALKPMMIKTEDNVSKTYTEGLMSINYIRSTFATSNFFKLIQQKELQNGSTKATAQMGYGIASSTVRIVFGISYLVLGLLILKMVNNNELSFIIGSSIFITYVAQASTIRSVGSLTQKIVENQIRLSDFFKFIRDFGKQTYPVLKE